MSQLSRENLALKFLLSVVAIRTAPKTMAEIRLASNRVTGNVCYIHPEDYAAISGVRVLPFVRVKALPEIQAWGLVPGKVIRVDDPVHDLRVIQETIEGIHQVEGGSLVLCTSLMPKGGVIYGPLSQAVLDWFDGGLSVEDFADFNHTQSGGLILKGTMAPRAPAPAALPAGRVDGMDEVDGVDGSTGKSAGATQVIIIDDLVIDAAE